MFRRLFQSPAAQRLVASQTTQQRALSLHEHQSLSIFKKFNVKVPNFVAVQDMSEVKAAASSIGDAKGKVVIKAQVLSGGRGMGHFKENGFQGGVHVIAPAAAQDIAGHMLGKTLVTKQNPGIPCNTLMFMEHFDISTEKYFAILMDRQFGGPIMIGSKTGGTSIEDIAEANPDAIVKRPVDIMDGLSEAAAVEMANEMGFEGPSAKLAADNILGLYKTFIECDCTMVEVNPFAELTDGRVVVCDAKVGFDDNAEFRQSAVFAQRDTSQEDPTEVEAKKYDLNYIQLDGQIGCMVNGAGLAMATMDLLTVVGGKGVGPRNFLDVGGAADTDQISAAFRLLQADKGVKSIFVNIFGGIMRCDVIANGIVEAAKQTGLSLPVVVRLEGTNVEEGKRILAESNLGLHTVDGFTEGAKKAVEVMVK